MGIGVRRRPPPAARPRRAARGRAGVVNGSARELVWCDIYTGTALASGVSAVGTLLTRQLPCDAAHPHRTRDTARAVPDRTPAQRVADNQRGPDARYRERFLDWRDAPSNDDDGLTTCCACELATAPAEYMQFCCWPPGGKA